MKTSILHLIALFLVLGFTASCGKKSEGGGGKDPNYTYNPITGGGQVVGSAGHTELVNWLNTPDNTASMQAFYVKKSGSMMTWFETQLCQIVGINLPGCIKPTSCFVSNNLGALGLGTTKFDNLRPKSCTLSGTFYNKANDTTLRDAVNGKVGRFVLKDRTTKTGNIYTVYYSLYEGNNQISGAAQFNTSLPAVLNPVILEENTTRTKSLFLAY